MGVYIMCVGRILILCILTLTVSMAPTKAIAQVPTVDPATVACSIPAGLSLAEAAMLAGGEIVCGSAGSTVALVVGTVCVPVVAAIGLGLLLLQPESASGSGMGGCGYDWGGWNFPEASTPMIEQCSFCIRYPETPSAGGASGGAGGGSSSGTNPDPETSSPPKTEPEGQFPEVHANCQPHSGYMTIFWVADEVYGEVGPPQGVTSDGWGGVSEDQPMEGVSVDPTCGGEVAGFSMCNNPAQTCLLIDESEEVIYDGRASDQEFWELLATLPGSIGINTDIELGLPPFGLYPRYLLRAAVIKLTPTCDCLASLG
ncbi:MAG: hypothetical protein K1X79_14400 [Oligoflexia bacterium]|nr:hypothetical protein [Oligoflexia bacterium]